MATESKDNGASANGVASTPASSSSSAKVPGFQRLPMETQIQILNHVRMRDLLDIAVVSKHFNELASSQIYKNLHILFDYADFRDRDPWDDMLAGSLDSMVTSSRQYSKHLRDLRFNSPNSGKKGETDYKIFSYNLSCGKFMNTLLVLALRHAKGLERFHWNIRVELSPSLLETLQKLPLLQHLHVRLPSGLPTWKSIRSSYPQPNPLPAPPVPFQPPPPPPGLSSSSIQPGFGVPAPGPSGSLLFTPPSPPPPVVLLPTHGISKPKTSTVVLRPHATSKRSTLGGFKGLATFKVLDIDDLEYVDDIANTITASWQTLKVLSISLSEDLASQSRMPEQPNTDDSDQDVDDLNGVQTPPPNSGEWSQEKESVARKNFQKQSSVLERLLCDNLSDSEDESDEKKKITFDDLDSGMNSDLDFSELEVQRLILHHLKTVSEKLVKVSKGKVSERKKLKYQKEALALLRKSVQTYVKSTPKKKGKPKASSSKTAKAKTDNVPANDAFADLAFDAALDSISMGFPESGPSSAPKSAHQNMNHITEMPNLVHQLPKPGLSDPHVSPPVGKKEKKTNFGSDPEGPSLFSDGPKPKPGKSIVTDPLDGNLGINIDFPDDDMVFQGSDNDEDVALEEEDVEEMKKNLNQSIDDALDMRRGAAAATQNGADSVEAKGKNAKNKSKDKGKAKKGTTGLQNSEKNGINGTENEKDAIATYVRKTRKMENLESFSLYLVPIKPAIIFKTIVLSSLKRITLFNVGVQDSFWSMMTRENRTTPLTLESISTDNVTKVFLSCVKALRKVTDLILIEPSRKGNDVLTGLAPPTRVKIEDIRRYALTKHMHSLRRLMIFHKQAPGYEWDLNAKTTKLIISLGGNLEELAVAFNMNNYHLILQNFTNLSSLRAFHILQLDLRDACLSVQTEIRRSVLDALAYVPNTKLRYVAYAESVDYVRHRQADLQRLKAAIKLEALNAKDETSDPGEGPSSGKGAVDVKGKGKAKVVPAHESDSDTDSSASADSDDESTSGSDSGLSTISTITDTHLKFDLRHTSFHKIEDVRIFRKDVRAGKL